MLSARCRKKRLAASRSILQSSGFRGLGVSGLGLGFRVSGLGLGGF